MTSKHRPILSTFVVTMIALAFFLSHPDAFAGLNYVKQTVTSDAFGWGSYAINDRGQVAWLGQADGGEQIYLYSNGTNTQITANTGMNMALESLQINNLGQIAWSQVDYDMTGSTFNVNVYLFDGNTIIQLNDNSGQFGWYSKFPHLNNRGEVAWIQSYQEADNGWDVYLYTGGGVQRLTNDQSRQGPPRLNDSGWVTWSGDQRQNADMDYRVYLYTGTIPAPVIAYSPGQSCTDPQINNQGQVAWLNYNSSATPNYNIYLWNGAETKITNLGGTNFEVNCPFVLNNAGQIAWSWGADSSRKQVYLYSGGSVSQLTNDYAFNHVNCRLRENGWMAWTRDDGSLASDIYAYRNGNATKLDQYSPFTPELNSRGQVVWATYYLPIFLASPVSAASAINNLLLN